MTRHEFDTWIEQHYSQLVAVARRRVNRDAQDVVHEAVLSFLINRDLATIARPWTYLVNTIRSVAGHQRRSEQRNQALERAIKNESRAGHSHGWKRPAPRAE